MIGRLKKISKLPDLNSRQIKLTDKPFAKIKELAPKVEKMSFEEMRSRIQEMKDELKPLVEKVPREQKNSLRKVERTKALPKHELDIQAKLQEFLPEVYAFMDEIFFRKMGMRYHDVQFRAGIILAQGQRLVELFTGEGKTMTFQLPLMLYSLAGRGAHLVTVNDYLSRRDGEYAGHIAAELGLSVGIVTSNANYKFVPDELLEMYKGSEGKAEREKLQSLNISRMDGINLIEVNKRDAYNADITYGTNNEFGFDYLRDNMAWETETLSQRELYFCIIDEADSILIDEARTPLIISGIPSDANTEKYIRFADAVRDLEENKHYIVDHKTRSVTMTEEGINAVEERLGEDNLWKDYSMAYHIENALKAQTMFNKDEHYLVKGGEVLIVDEFTGRILKGRRYSEGLHQAIEAKERVEIKQESKTYATITFQNFFRLYKVLCGGSGTVMTEAEEFYKIYGLETVPVPTNKPVIRQDFPDRIYKNQQAKFKAVVKEVKEKHEKGQPVLIGTTSVEKSEIVSQLLDAERIPHEVLNAKYHEQEAKIIERAGRKGAVTVATNMAGRGADIVIGGGIRGDQAYQEIKELGGLHVIGTERHESRRIDNQLRGRTGRQGEPGSSRFYVALDDQLMKVLGGELMGRLMSRVGLQDDMPIEMGFISRQIESSQKRIEGLNFDNRKKVVEYDDVMNQHREIFYTKRRLFLINADEASGNFVIDGKVVNVLRDDKLKKEYESRIEEAKANLEKMIVKIAKDEIELEVTTLIVELRKANEENYRKVISKFLEIVPEYVAAKLYGTSVGKLKDTIYEEIKRMKLAELPKYFSSKSEKVVELKRDEFPKEFHYLVKAITLKSMDDIWVDHLEMMKDIREGIGLQAYAQKDPLVEYKNEAYNVFQIFMENVNSKVIKDILNIQKANVQSIEVPQQPVQQLTTNQPDIEDVLTEDREFVTDEVVATGSKIESVVRKIERDRQAQSLTMSRSADGGSKKLNVTAFKDVGRNDPCPCGSGKKFKKCHGANL